jgi:hypothetical protein
VAALIGTAIGFATIAAVYVLHARLHRRTIGDWERRLQIWRRGRSGAGGD